MSTTTSSATTEETVSSPLPQDAQASEPTEARGTVEERTVTGIEEELTQSGENVETITQTGTEGTKEFYMISTKSGKVFYLIVDNSRSQDNVYFLTEVSEKDLMNFTLSDTVTLPDVGTVYAEPEEQEPEPEETPETEDAETEEVQMPEDKSPVGSYLLIGLVAVGALGAGYYFKIYKPKHEYDDEDEYEEDDAEENEEEPTEPDDADEETISDEAYSEEVLEDEEE